MNIRCAFCQTPYTLSRVEMLDALQEMDSKKLTHYDAHCPRCRRATQIPRQRIEMFMPNWRDELKAFEAEMKEHPQQEAPAPESAPAPVAETASTAEPKAAEKKPTPKPKPAEAKVATTSSPKEKSAPKKAPTTKKAATKKSK
jgi:hypothetical protein